MSTPGLSDSTDKSHCCSESNRTKATYACIGIGVGSAVLATTTFIALAILTSIFPVVSPIIVTGALIVGGSLIGLSIFSIFTAIVLSPAKIDPPEYYSPYSYYSPVYVSTNTTRMRNALGDIARRRRF